MIKELHSNAILSDSVLYWASREEIVALDSTDGHLLWKTRLPERPEAVRIFLKRIRRFS